MKAMTRNLQLRNAAPDLMSSPTIMRTSAPSIISLPPVTGQREPGSAYMTIWTAPTPGAGMSNPRTAGTRTKRS